MRNRAQPALDIDRLVAAAFAQLEDDGVESVSMRRIAERVGVQAPALYWHVGDKAELLGLMAREIYAEAFAAVPQAADWSEWLRLYGAALRQTYAAHRDGARLCAVATPASTSDPLAHADHIAAPLMSLGLCQRDAISFQASVVSFTIGWATFEANGPMHQFLDQMLDFEDSFASGLNALVEGFRISLQGNDRI
jgi:TetR/AcrR family tetracycline transcriptional repressor